MYQFTRDKLEMEFFLNFSRGYVRKVWEDVCMNEKIINGRLLIFLLFVCLVGIIEVFF